MAFVILKEGERLIWWRRRRLFLFLILSLCLRDLNVTCLSSHTFVVVVVLNELLPFIYSLVLLFLVCSLFSFSCFITLWSSSCQSNDSCVFFMPSLVLHVCLINEPETFVLHNIHNRDWNWFRHWSSSCHHQSILWKKKNCSNWSFLCRIRNRSLFLSFTLWTPDRVPWAGCLLFNHGWIDLPFYLWSHPFVISWFDFLY